MKQFEFHNAINYSGYRDGQSPITNSYPSKDEILEDLRLLEGDFYYIRIYDCSTHGHRVLEVITEYDLPFKVMLGLSLHAEVNHENHPYFYVHKADQLRQNKIQNQQLVEEIIALATRYKEIVSSISIGNEVQSIWNNNRLTEAQLVTVATTIKERTNIPITYCEEYQHWVEGLEALADVVDFISIHTYPAWQGAPIEQALDVAIANYHEVQMKYPDKYCIITETGWPTKSHGSKIKIEDANVKHQLQYNKEITEWGKRHNTLVYLFEAFDEPWKGGNHPDEPEKNWGIYNVKRTKK